MKIKELQEQRAAIKQELRDILDRAEKEERNLTAEERKAFKAKENELSELDENIEIAQRSVNIIGKAEPVQKSEERASLGATIKAIAQGRASNELEERALSSATPSAGGYSIDDDIQLSRWFDKLRVATRAFQAGAQMIPLTSLTTSAVKLATDPIAAWRAEGAALNSSDPVLGEVKWTAKSLGLTFDVPRELMDDSVNLDSIIEAAITRQFAEKLDAAILVGDGTGNSPVGISGTVGVGAETLTGGPAAFADYSKIIAAIGAVRGSNATPSGIIMGEDAMQALAALTASDGQPLQMPAYVSSIPMYATTALEAANEAIVGDFSQVLVGVRKSLEIRSNPYVKGSTNTLQVEAVMRADVAVVQPTAFCVISAA